MKLWPFRRRETLSAEPSDEAREALRQAKRALVEAEQLDCAARDVAERLSAARARNHFAAAVLKSIRGA